MAIAAGLPVPRIHLIDDTAPNAFATGRDPAHASVAITTGLRDKLTRDELQGVMAHEMSHVRNLDIRFMVLMSVMVGAVALLCDFFLRSMRYRRLHTHGRRGKDNAAAGIFLILALVLALFAPLFSKLLQLAVSREREYLADSSAVELTRNPEGLASALEKISSDPEILEAANRATQHLYIVNPIKPFEDRSKSLFSTHPPMQERIARIRSFNRSAPVARMAP
jgi:heat shock protein HtpX